MLNKFPAFKDEIGLDTDDDIRRGCLRRGPADEAPARPRLRATTSSRGSATGPRSPRSTRWRRARRRSFVRPGQGRRRGRGRPSRRSRTATASGDGTRGGWAIDGDWAVLAETDEIADAGRRGRRRGAAGRRRGLPEVDRRGRRPRRRDLYAAPEAGELADSRTPASASTRRRPDFGCVVTPSPIASPTTGFGRELRRAATCDPSPVADARRARRGVRGLRGRGADASASTTAPSSSRSPATGVEDSAEERHRRATGRRRARHPAGRHRRRVRRRASRRAGSTTCSTRSSASGDRASTSTSCSSRPRQSWAWTCPRTSRPWSASRPRSRSAPTSTPRRSSTRDGSRQVPVGVKIKGDPDDDRGRPRQDPGADGPARSGSSWSATSDGDVSRSAPTRTTAPSSSRTATWATPRSSRTSCGRPTRPRRLFVNFDAGDGWLVELAGDDEEAADNLEPLQGVGMSAWIEDDVSHGVLRLTTDD